MASDVNQCNFIGRLGRDPEVRFMPNGKAVTNFSIAVSQQWRNEIGDKKEKTEWVPVSAFGKAAEIIGEYAKKGQQMYVSGRFQTREYEKGGVKHYRSEILLDQFQFLGGKPERSDDRPASDYHRNEPISRPEPAGQDAGFDDDIPF